MFVFAQDYVGIPQGSIRATVLIETILGAFEMDEILYELRDHSAGLNCGRWDYIFSFIKKFRNRPDFVLPNRAQVTMTVHFLASYVDLLIQTCHKRGIHAMGGMAAQIPIKNDPGSERRGARESAAGQAARSEGRARRHLGGAPRRWCRSRSRCSTSTCRRRTRSIASAKTCTSSPPICWPFRHGTITKDGLRLNIDVGIQYLEAWLRGNGACRSTT